MYCVIQEFTQQCYSTDTYLKAGKILKDSSSSKEQMNCSCPLPVLSSLDRAWDQSTKGVKAEMMVAALLPGIPGSSCQMQPSVSNAQTTTLVHICAVAQRAHTPRLATLDTCSLLPLWGASTVSWRHWWDEMEWTLWRATRMVRDWCIPLLHVLGLNGGCSVELQEAHNCSMFAQTNLSCSNWILV